MLVNFINCCRDYDVNVTRRRALYGTFVLEALHTQSRRLFAGRSLDRAVKTLERSGRASRVGIAKQFQEYGILHGVQLNYRDKKLST